MDIKIKKLHPNAVMPKKAHESDFGFDVVATSCEEVKPGIYKYGIGLAFESNCEATIDYDYRGEVSLMFEYVRPELPKYEVGDRIAQIKVGIAPKARFVWADELSNTERGGGAYGSSGK